MAELTAELLRWTFLTLSNPATVHHDVVGVLDSIDFDRSEFKIFEEHFDRMIRLSDCDVPHTSGAKEARES